MYQQRAARRRRLLLLIVAIHLILEKERSTLAKQDVQRVADISERTERTLRPAKRRKTAL